MTTDPTGLRRTALVATVTALGLGWALGSSRGGRPAVHGLALGTALGGIAIAVVGRRHGQAIPEGPRPRSEPGLVDIRVPARDEAFVVGDVIADLGRQLPGSEFRLTVIDDRSVDGTGDVARGAIVAAGLGGVARVIRRSDGPDGKAGALAVVDGPSERAEAILVLDADARVDPWFVARARRAIAEGAIAATARRRVRRPIGGDRLERLLLDAQAVEQSADDVLQRGRLAFGGAAELRGNGMLIRTGLLDALGGWPGDAVTEDLELSTRGYLRTGRGAVRPTDLEVWEQAPSTSGAMIRQRLRWAEGSVRRDLRVVLPALRDGRVPLRRRADVALWSGPDLAPWLVVGLLAAGARHRSAAAAAELAVGLGVAIAALALAADEPQVAPLRRIASLALLVVGWAVILPVAWLRILRDPSPPAFRPTTHCPGAAFGAPPFRTTEGPGQVRAAPSRSRREPNGSPAATTRRGGAGGDR